MISILDMTLVNIKDIKVTFSQNVHMKDDFMWKNDFSWVFTESHILTDRKTDFTVKTRLFINMYCYMLLYYINKI